MPEFVTHGACIRCSDGAAPTSLIVLAPKVNACGKPIANKNDAKPGTNIIPFGFCTKIQQACVPVTHAWDTSSNVNVRGCPAVDASCTAACKLGGKIEVISPGQTTVNKS